MEQVHATCVEIDGVGVLIRGDSGSGKSDLSLRLIDAGAHLVADDRVDLRRVGKGISASAPQEIAGMLEVRGVGITKTQFTASAAVGLVVELVSPDVIERLPEPASCHYMEVPLRLVRLSAFEASAPAKVRWTLALLAGRISAVS
ncbi:MAG: HPr kinase/phosphatase C-terminal domain-containing protein [Alphaproteobacteria bacterium]|nr:HPr kinase/phosphatase C-terminal domain-containing protein [Alphaproteobacteria bacterium]